MVSMSSVVLLASVAACTAPLLAAALPLSAEESGLVPMGSMGLARKLKVSAMGGSKAGYGTWFHGMGTPHGGCGVPPNKAVDDNGKPVPFVALNTNSEWDNGAHCGEWIRMVVGKNCQGGGNSEWSVCNGGTMGDDEHTGSVMYGYVMDQCPDNNVWCKNDPHHLDISEAYLHSMGMREGSSFNARMLHWDYIDYVPEGWSMKEPKFMWMEGSRWISHQFWASVVIYNTSNGIGKVEQKMPEIMGGEWVTISQLTNLGNNYELKRPCVEGSPDCNATPTIGIRVTDSDGNVYGSWDVNFNCVGHVCGSPQDANAVKMN